MWDLLGLQGSHIIGLQEVGALPQKIVSNDIVLNHEIYLAGVSFTFFYSNPSHAWRGSAVGVPTNWLGKVEKTVSFCTGVGLVLKDQGLRQYCASLHLPHKLREDCLQVWQQQVDELSSFCCPRRYHDEIFLCADLNYDILDITNVDERGIPFGQLLRVLGLEHSRPLEPTWNNTSGSSSRIDFLLFMLPSMQKHDDRVLVGSDSIIGSDHCAVSITLQSLATVGRRHFRNSKCGKWWTSGPALEEAATSLATDLDLNMKDLTMPDLEAVCSKASKRVTSCRFVDTPEIKSLIAERRSSRGQAARELSRRINNERKHAKKLWLQGLLQKSAEGDFRAVSYFKKRNSALYTQGSYCMRAGGRAHATSQLRSFYSKKYTPSEPMPSGLPLAIFRSAAGPILNPMPISQQEISDVAFMCKHNKSTGDDGISYEALQQLMQSELAPHITDLFNGVLLGLVPIPPSWLLSHVCFLPKTSCPSVPSDLRPIVLSSTVAKVFTKILMIRLRPVFPPIQAFQVGGIPQRQTLDATCAVQHAIRLSEEYGKPLVIIKLNVSAAFDSLSHEAVARFLASAKGAREAELLLQIVRHSSVQLSLQGTSWNQDLKQGILQGSSYSAELFARCVDHFLAPLNQQWHNTEQTWLQTPEGRKLFLCPFADDLVLIATSRMQAQRLLTDCERTLGAIGLRFNWKKCKYIQTPGLPKAPLDLSHGGVQWQPSFIFLGVLIGFQLTCVAVLSARMSQVSNAFWGYYQILRQSCVGLTQRLRMFDCFITAKWRWLSPTVRPTQKLHQYLRTLQTTFLSAMLRFPRDPFQGAVDSWIARRRAARLAAQQVGHRPWQNEHARSFFGYWGHAARYCSQASIPISVLLQVRGPDWLFANSHISKRLPGKWADTSRFLQLAWEQYLQHKHIHPIFSWIRGAQDRELWKNFSQYWMSTHNAIHNSFYPQSPENVDLKGCQLVQNQDFFTLLPLRHPPVEEPYSTSFLNITSRSDDTGQEIGAQEHLFRVYSDGSATQNRRGCAGFGGAAVVVLAPYTRVEQASVCHFRVAKPCTNIQAELQAAAQALRMIKILRTHFQHVAIQYFTDSQYVLQILEGSFQGTHYASVTNEIICLWSELCIFVEASHVRAHSGVTLNEIADKFAKQGAQLNHYQKVFHTLDFQQATLTRHSSCDVFTRWI